VSMSNSVISAISHGNVKVETRRRLHPCVFVAVQITVNYIVETHATMSRNAYNYNSCKKNITGCPL
jgi:hypothetical protein